MIQTLDAALAGMQWPRFFHKSATPALIAGKPQSLWGLAGLPGAGAFNTTLAGVALSSTSAQVNGQIPFADAAGGQATYLARFQGAATIPGTLILADRLWHNGGLSITSTAAQTLNSAAFPARDADGSINGKGVLLGLEISAATGAGTPTITAGYTNSANASGKTAVNSFPTAATAAAGSFFPIGLAAGDLGVKSVQTLQLSATWTSGTMNLVAYRPLVAIELMGALIPAAVDALTSGFPRLFDGTVPFLIFIPSTTTASNVAGQLVMTQG